MDRALAFRLRRHLWCVALFGGTLLSANVAAAEYLPTAPPSPAGDEPIARREWLRWWVFDLDPQLSTQAVYDDNVNISSRAAQEDVIWVTSPGITAVAGDPLSERARLLTISYSPSFVVFTDHSEYDSIDHFASVAGIWPFSKLTLGFRQTFEQNTGGIVDVGERVERRSYATSLTSSYELSEKTSFEVNGRQQISDYPGPLIGSREWSNDNWLNYLITAKVVMGLGVTFGYLDLDRNPSQQYERALLRAVYKLSYKLDLNASAGGELRQYGEGPDRLGAIFGMGASYWPRDGTSISLQAHRDNRNSALLAGQNYISSGVSLRLRQRFADRYFLNLTGTYENAEYEAALNGITATRAENYYLVHSGFEVAINERWMAGAFYRRRENLSNSDSFGFSNNQVGLQTSYQF